MKKIIMIAFLMMAQIGLAANQTINITAGTNYTYSVNNTYSIDFYSVPNVCSFNISTINYTTTVVQNVTWIGSNMTFLEEKYATCKGDLTTCQSQKDFFSNQTNILSPYKDNATLCSMQYNQLTTNYQGLKSTSEQEKSNQFFFGIALGVGAYYFLGRKQEKGPVSPGESMFPM